MIIRTLVKLRGVSFHQGRRLLDSKKIKISDEVTLKHEPHNPHDSNAVGVYLCPGEEMLGHIPRELAPKYVKLLKSKRVIEAKILDITKVGSVVSIQIEIDYDTPEDIQRERLDSLLWKSASLLKAGPGVYAIKNTKTGRIYIGSSANVRNRIKSHAIDLEFSTHVNHLLLADFKSLGADFFLAELLEDLPQKIKLLDAEANHIKNSHNAGIELYNLTSDGQGLSSSKNRKNYYDQDEIDFNTSRKKQFLIEESPRRLKSFQNIPIDDLIQIRASLSRYIKRLNKIEEENKKINKENDLLERRKESRRAEIQAYDARYILPAIKDLEAQVHYLKQNEVSFISSLWSKTTEVTIERIRGLNERIKLKNSPENLRAIDEYNRKLAEFKKLNDGKPSDIHESSSKLKKLPKVDKIMNISGRDVIIHYPELDLKDLDTLIISRSQPGKAPR